MIRWRDEADALHEGSLFGAFAALARGEAWSFPALRPHQREPWHAFTVQCAAMALTRAGVDTLPPDEAAWRELLVALSDGVPEAWELVVEDWSKPALLQPPVPAAKRVNFAPSTDAPAKRTPDVLDMLVTSRNHELKRFRMERSDPEHWLFSLVTLQTMEGQMGRGNYGISRMKGGYSTRSSIGIRPFGGAGVVFCRDVRLLVADARTRSDYRRGLSLVWTMPWDGEAQIAAPDLDELYVEICRLIRIVRTHDAIEAWTANSSAARIAVKGQTGYRPDPWAPTRADGASISPPPSKYFGFLSYRQFAKYLDRRETKLPLLSGASHSDDAKSLLIVANSLVRGEGGTEGLHRRAIRTSWVHEDEDTGDITVADWIGDVAVARAKEAADASRRLRHALIILISGGRDRDDLVRAQDSDAEEWTAALRRFDLTVDREFFEAPFWAEVARPTDPKHRRSWRLRLRGIAERTLAEAIEAAPRTAMRRDEAAARAENRLGWDMDQWLKEVPGDE